MIGPTRLCKSGLVRNSRASVPSQNPFLPCHLNWPLSRPGHSATAGIGTNEGQQSGSNAARSMGRAGGQWRSRWWVAMRETRLRLKILCLTTLEEHSVARTLALNSASSITVRSHPPLRCQKRPSPKRTILYSAECRDRCFGGPPFLTKVLPQRAITDETAPKNLFSRIFQHCSSVQN